ncbi:carbamoyl-phosphate synthase large subunit [Parabacteroides sp. PH5-13]|nr:carbamoyl-phosphate synthase large subunit [Parabacteroides sp. PH5-39]MDH6319853.1 carbamoyl-phosphate synthase large subunit [Parabacteroides sp. PH5-13]MDH6323556.1 carbamoyl-phosphate synthase large subunit [Parabacteroides sp. PH5-8]MDH6384668.1 carbamoyl-phosphate synthase large subunit [Parabacteroides sp. PH5-17]MDH6394023.1 carbamoyl-phosphate synthase large subunit [Parabacteroides sp. PFB2-22]MDH6407134.1 carbamoyl-phosphate synthase large subunit [Parabacteroides sp. PH5-26]
MNNILITSVGKRVSLIKLLQETLDSLSIKSEIYTTDMNPQLAPAGIISTKCIKVPKVTDSSYIDYLLEICKKYHIRIIVPTIDVELLTLSENRNRFITIGVIPVVCNSSFVKICRDKRNITVYLEGKGIAVPKAIDKYNPTFPIFAKPYDGSLSQDLHVIKNREELTCDILNHPKLIFMEYIDKNKYKEFTVDMYYGKDNKVKMIVPRERIEIRAGEISKGYTRKNELVKYLQDRLSFLSGVVGCICFQLFYREESNEVIGIEINPRFGGGYPLTHYAKANFWELLIREYLLEETLQYSDSWLDNTLMLRYDAEIIVYS